MSGTDKTCRIKSFRKNQHCPHDAALECRKMMARGAIGQRDRILTPSSYLPAWSFGIDVRKQSARLMHWSASAHVPGPLYSGFVSATIASISVSRPPGLGGTPGLWVPFLNRLQEPCVVPPTNSQSGQEGVGPQCRKSCQFSAYQKSNRLVYSTRIEFAVASRSSFVQLSGGE
eukprot:SAG31_NODE_756_length_12303_cov_8.918142_10_plen_173_part_00